MALLFAICLAFLAYTVGVSFPGSNDSGRLSSLLNIVAWLATEYYILVFLFMLLFSNHKKVVNFGVKVNI